MREIPLKDADFDLDVSGIGGFFGDEESFAAMSSVHLVRGRRWFGWYNSPGSYFVAKRYGLLARSRIWDGLYPGPNIDPTSMLELDGKEGPRYVGAHSGTRIQKTGHLSYLLSSYCSDLEVDYSAATPATSDVYITVVHLDEFAKFPGYPVIPKDGLSPFDPACIIPIAASLAAAVACAVFGDWFCFSTIMLGCFCNGISCVVIGSGKLKIVQPNSSLNSPPGDGILFNTSGRVVLLKGSEQVVSSITRGRFNLEYKSESRYHDIGLVSLALTFQFLLQLFIVPQGELFGQIMFLSTFAVSWLYNAYLASVDREDLQKRLLINNLLQKPTVRTVRLPKWTALVTFSALVLQAGKNTRAILDEMIPTDTHVWRIVKDTIIKSIQRNQIPNDVLPEQNLEGLDEKELGLLRDMLEQATIGLDAAKKELESVEGVKDEKHSGSGHIV